MLKLKQVLDHPLDFVVRDGAAFQRRNGQFFVKLNEDTEKLVLAKQFAALAIGWVELADAYPGLKGYAEANAENCTRVSLQCAA